MTDGPTQIIDVDKTPTNKVIVKDFMTSVLQGKNPEKFPSFFNGESYIQHNPLVPDGVWGLTAALWEFAKQGMTLQYNRTNLVPGEGNFVLVASEGSLARSR